MKKIGTLLAAALFTTAAWSDTLGGEIAVGGWSHDPSGWIEYPTGSNRVDLDSDLSLSTKSEIYFRLQLEHPLPGLPNILFGYTKNRSDGTGTLSKSFTFGNTTFNVNERVYTETRLDNYDLTLYYEIIDSAIDVDLGLTARYIDGYAKITSLTTNLSDQSDFSVVFPMIYADIQIPVPALNGLSVGASGNWVSYSGSTVYDAQAYLKYRFAAGFGVEGGYRAQKIKIDDIDDTSTDIDIKGAYLGLIWDF